MFKIVSMIVMLLAGILAALPCYSQEGSKGGQQHFQASRTTETVEGRLLRTDWVGSTFMIRYLGDSDFVEKKFLVSSDTRYSKDDDTDMGLADLEENDLITVEYYTDSSGVLHATSVTVSTD
jgi:hypothetical protein